MDSRNSMPHLTTPFLDRLASTLVFLLRFLTGGQVVAQRTVTDEESGETLPGANIQIKGITVGTSSDINGRFQLSTNNPQAVLVFSLIDYLSNEVAIRNSSQIHVSLAPNLSALDEVAGAGYGRVKKNAVTSTISKIENDKLDRIPAGRAERILVGGMAGVNISTKRSTPGAVPIIRSRRAGSISASNALLVVIGGFAAGSLNNVNMKIWNP